MDKIKETEKTIIEITFDQMNNFAGNMLEVQNLNGDQYLVMSSNASFSEQKSNNQIQQYVQILHSLLIPLKHWVEGVHDGRNIFA